MKRVAQWAPRLLSKSVMTPIYFVSIGSVTMLTRLGKWIDSVFEDRYEVTIWMIKPDGTASVSLYPLKKLQKITQYHLKGIDVNGHKIEMRTVEKFSYEVKKVK